MDMGLTEPLSGAVGFDILANGLGIDDDIVGHGEHCLPMTLEDVGGLLKEEASMRDRNDVVAHDHEPEADLIPFAASAPTDPSTSNRRREQTACPGEKATALPTASSTE